MRTFTSLGIRPNRRIIRRKIRSCDSGINRLRNEVPTELTLKKALRCSSSVPQCNRVTMTPFAIKAFLCKQTINNFRTRTAPGAIYRVTVYYLFLISHISDDTCWNDSYHCGVFNNSNKCRDHCIKANNQQHNHRNN